MKPAASLSRCDVMGPGIVWCLDCRRAVPMGQATLINTVPAYCPHCKLRMRYGFNQPAGAYEPTEDDKETFRCAGMVWTD